MWCVQGSVLTKKYDRRRVWQLLAAGAYQTDTTTHAGNNRDIPLHMATVENL